MAGSRPVGELATEGVLHQLQEQIMIGGGKAKNEKDVEQELRARLDEIHLQIFHHTQAETTKRWTYESEIKRPYYHVTALDDGQLANWRNYLDFEEAEGDYTRIRFLYERCLVTAANYSEFWLRYARWMYAHSEKQEEVRNIYQRASCIYVPIDQPEIRRHYAQFEEAEGRPQSAVAIHEAILDKMPDHVPTILALANVQRRQYGFDAGIEVLQQYTNEGLAHISGELTCERARMVRFIKGSPDDAREVYQTNQHMHLDSLYFFDKWLRFEIAQPIGTVDEHKRYERVKSVFETARTNSRLSPAEIETLAATYLVYLKDTCGNREAIKEFMRLDTEIYGPSKIIDKMDLDPESRIGAGTGVGTMQAQQGVPSTNGGLSIRA